MADTPDKVEFKSIETVEGSDGTANTGGIEFIIEVERDGEWCVSQERVLPENDKLGNDVRRRCVLFAQIKISI